MQCPKNKKIELVEGTLADTLKVQCCPDCKGTWIPAEHYASWQAQQPLQEASLDLMGTDLDINFVQSPLDTRASLCPECNRYLSRARVEVKPPFYVERCLACGGIWCDRGEWDVLEKLGLHTTIPKLFTTEWQTQVREKQQANREREATIEKLGPEIAERIFELAEVLEQHPNGDFGVAYLMRRFDR